jgi:hypothetical protein
MLLSTYVTELLLLQLVQSWPVERSYRGQLTLARNLPNCLKLWRMVDFCQ